MEILLSIFLVGSLDTSFDIQYFRDHARHTSSEIPEVSGWFISSGDKKLSIYPATIEAAETLSKGLDTSKIYHCDAKAYRSPESTSVGVYQSQGQLMRYVYIVYELQCKPR